MIKIVYDNPRLYMVTEDQSGNRLDTHSLMSTDHYKLVGNFLTFSNDGEMLTFHKSDVEFFGYGKLR